MTRTPWRTKPSSKPKSEIFVATKPGKVVSVEQMVSTLSDFVAQMTGKLTKRRYTGSTVVVDHFSILNFVFLMESNFTNDETIRAKEAFERFAQDHGVIIRQYHADNGRFKDNTFVQHCSSSNYVNAHFQNSIAEKAIRDLSTETTCKQLLFAKARWPETINMSLWPYALCQAACNDYL
ncbi:hypothetical protein ACHAWF_000039, partial [Thalassiosira exigua]